jgi:16S rRNA (guanine527-N7)-methyltransferase
VALSSRPSAASPSAIDAGQLRPALDSLKLQLSDLQLEQLSGFAQLLLRWNAVHNLTSIEVPEEVISHHLLDSLAILGEIRRIVGDHVLRVLDVGAGGGLPGIPLAIADPDLHVTLVDKVQKKVAFLTQVKLELGLTNIECLHSRVEALRPVTPYDIVVARAFASLAELVRTTRHLLAPNGHWFAMKGALPRSELDELGRLPGVRVQATVKLHVPRLDAERHLIVLQPL